MLNSTGPPTAGPPVLVPDHVSAEPNRLPDHETVETLYRLGERDRIVGIFGGCVRPPEVEIAALIPLVLGQHHRCCHCVVCRRPIARRSGAIRRECPEIAV
jgi:hypothetical protein